MDGLVEEGWRSERRVRLIEAASRVFARQAYDQASMDEIAHEAGVGKPTLYRYFPSKDELFATVFAEVLDGVERRLAAVLERERGFAGRLRGLVRVLIPTFRDHLVTGRVLGEGAAALDLANRRVFRDRRDRITGFLVEAIEGGIAAGEVRWSADPASTAHLVMGMVWSGAAGIQASGAEVADEIARLVLGGVGESVNPGEEPAERHRGEGTSPTGRGRPREATRS